MARKKVSLQWITNTLTRRATYKRRCQGLMKKASELETLSGAKVCVVVYEDGMVQPEVWPNDHQEARQFLLKYKEMPETGNLKKVENQKDFLGGRVTKLLDQLQKSESENNEREALDLLHERMNGRRRGLFGTSHEELERLREIVRKKRSEAKERLKQLGVVQGSSREPPPQLLPGSSSTQPPSPHPNTEMQMLAPLEESLPPQQNDLLVDWPVNNSGELSISPYNTDLGSSSGCAGPSNSGRDMMQPYSPGGYPGFPLASEWSPFPPME
ncbi:hypothetical protein HU200_056825 [Digitaria exilis]|uniref:MADS-box domain-containing protein n=1 Tax=Digitaria exilis TaxID=1010633 RepID=A0A835E0M9_9POAL|nr:hypothetical protein HU200_056825 [Digitaria exilis]